MNRMWVHLGVAALMGVACLGVGCKPVPPSVAFIGAPLSGTAPLTVLFMDQSTIGKAAHITGWTWTFGDGSSSTARNPFHVYTTPGTYTVILSVKASNGTTTTNRRENYVVVSAPGNPGEGEGEPVQVTVPNVVGMFQSLAESAIVSEGLVVGTVTEQHHATVPAGRIISQNPSAGASLTQGMAVDLVVSSGPGDGSGDTLAILLPGNILLELVRIPAGSFRMGSPDTERSRWSAEGPTHLVNIGYDFYMGKYEVTQGQWLAMMGTSPGGSTWDYDGMGVNYPAYGISWDDAQTFITAVNAHITSTGQGPATLRLPSEAEWEYACRAGTQTRFYFGDSLEVDDECGDDGVRSQYMWYCGNNADYGEPGYGTKPVGNKLPNAFGLHDMSGNVWEWCEDWWHSDYTGAPTDGSAWIVSSTASRVVRGGFYRDNANFCRSALRDNYIPSERNLGNGFRLASVQDEGEGEGEPVLITVPNVVGMTQSAAQAAITGVGLVVGTVTEQHNSTVPAGQVISQTPAAGGQVAAESAVALVVSLGPELEDGVIGEEGGTVTTDTGVGLEVPPDQLTRDVIFSVGQPSPAEIREALDPSVPYAGVATVLAAPTPEDPNTPVDATALSMIITVPVTPAQVPGTLLEVYQRGEIPGEWIQLEAQATVGSTGTTASFTTNLVGTFIVRVPDSYSVGRINYDEDKAVKRADISFVPAAGFGLHRVPFHAGSNPGTGRIPIVLIHGVGSHEATQPTGGTESPGSRYARWDNFIDWCVSGGIDMSTYQLWMYLHQSYSPAGYDYGGAGEITPNNVRTLTAELESARASKGFPGAEQQFVILAHSRGGLVARAFVEKSGMADQVMAVLTLATPHHGSPLAVPEWGYHVLNKFRLNDPDLDLFDVVRLVGAFKSVEWWLPGYADLAWDNFDGTAPHGNGIPDRTFMFNAWLNGVLTLEHHLTTNDAGWPNDSGVTDPTVNLPNAYLPVRRAGTTLWDLNQGPGANTHLDKFIFYGGYIPSPVFKSFWEHAGLRVLVPMMQRCESRNAEGPHFAANDGMVPLQSALYLNAHDEEPLYALERGWWGLGELRPVTPLALNTAQIAERLPLANKGHARLCSGFDHLDMVAGKGELFDRIGDDLDGTVSSTPAAAFTVTGNSGGSVTIDASASADRGTALWPASSPGALSYRVDWGLGVTPQFGAWQGNPVFGRSYAAIGTYAVSVQVRDGDGMIGTVSKNITVGTGGDTVTILLPGNVPLELVRIPAGSFQMGSPDTERSRWSDEGPAHPVTIGYDYYMGKYEVTQGQWLAMMGSWPGTAPSSYGVGSDYPAYNVSWTDAQAFVTAVNAHITATGQGPATLRLPSEAEWEYACRAGTQTRFYFGDSLGVADNCEDDGVRSQYMWYCGNNTGSPGQPGYGSKPVGEVLPNSFGLYDMHANVYEWCADYWHNDYTGAPADGSAWVVPSATNRVIRGGYWNFIAVYCRSGDRHFSSPLYRGADVGFRLAADH